MVAAVEASGLTPLDYLLSVMRDEANDTEMRIDAAHKAAPFVHAKLSSIEQSTILAVSDPIRELMDQVAETGRRICDL